MKPLIIIGAPRSGTKMLRDLLCALPGVGTWPCDEINYIWRFGNRAEPTDALRPEQATEPVRSYIRSRFEKISGRLGLAVTVEKTCANSLRVDFVDRVIPEARYVFLVRDGRDAAASAMKRWAAPLEPIYLMRKARFVPVSDIPYYAWRYLGDRFRRRAHPERRVSLWGPVFEGLAEIVRERGLAAACAAQWAECVEAAARDLDRMAPERVLRVRYEQFVQQPAAWMQKLALFADREMGADDLERVVSGVTAGNVGKWRRDLDDRQQSDVEAAASETLTRYGYVD